MAFRKDTGGGWLALATAASLVFNGCMQAREGKSYVQECVLRAEQRATISGRWPITPIPIAFHTGSGFTTDEIRAITDSIDTWNDFHDSVHGDFPLMDYGTKSSPYRSNQSVPSAVCSEGIVRGNSFSGQVVLYKYSTWPSSYDENVIALTSFCPYDDNPFPRIYNGIIELNYEHFFRQGKKLPDIESIMLHEFGHLVGLNHSCETFSKAETPNCNDPDLPREYFMASLFPIILFPDKVHGEVRDELQQNDQERGNCLYYDKTGVEVLSESP